MSFRPLDFKKIVAGKYVLNEEYLLSYSYSDGWTDRLLSFSMFIDIYYEYRGEISFYNRKRKEDQKTEIEFGFETPFETPAEIKNLTDLLLNQNEIELKFYYSDFFIEDPRTVNFVINQKGISHNVTIAIMLKELENKNESEKIIFLLQKEFEKLREEMYQKLLLDE